MVLTNEELKKIETYLAQFVSMCEMTEKQANFFQRKGISVMKSDLNKLRMRILDELS